MKGGEFLDQQLASEEVNCSMEFVAKQPDAVLCVPSPRFVSFLYS
jgi:hypothetical protein